MSGTRSFSYDLLDSHQGGSFAATRVVLSALQDARSCAEVAHAVLGMRSLLWRPVRQVLPAVRCCGLLAVACKADSARYIFWFLPQVAAGHLQALLGLVLLVQSIAGYCSTVGEEGRSRLAPLKSEDSFGYGHAEGGWQRLQITMCENTWRLGRSIGL